MEHINRIEIQGIVGAVRTQTIFDQQVVNMSVVTQEFYKNKEDIPIAEITWHNVVVWQDKSSSDLSKVEKGSEVYAVGRLRQQKYTDASGIEKVYYEILANEFRIIEE
jgi:single-stranded DNA-binding protein